MVELYHTEVGDVMSISFKSLIEIQHQRDGHNIAHVGKKKRFLAALLYL